MVTNPQLQQRWQVDPCRTSRTSPPSQQEREREATADRAARDRQTKQLQLKLTDTVFALAQQTEAHLLSNRHVSAMIHVLFQRSLHERNCCARPPLVVLITGRARLCGVCRTAIVPIAGHCPHQEVDHCCASRSASGGCSLLQPALLILLLCSAYSSSWPHRQHKGNGAAL